MPSASFDPYTHTITLAPAEADLVFFAKIIQAFKDRYRRDRYIDYSFAHAYKAYQDSTDVEYVESKNRTQRLPYQILFDYRKSKVTDWGRVFFEGKPYRFPGALAEHKEQMVKDFTKRGLLSKGDQCAPRVSGFSITDGLPQLLLQEALYYDQVGSNLSIDFRFSESIIARGHQCHSVREWDIAQAYGEENKLPSFYESKLANTIGVAIGVSARSLDGRTFWLRRKRSKHVAVYADMWHVPFSFALCVGKEAQKTTDLESLIRFDLGHELGEELGGLEQNDFDALRPVAICRDLARGGKAQFFLELPCLLSFEELSRRIRERMPVPEFSGHIAVAGPDATEPACSPELACFLLLNERQG